MGRKKRVEEQVNHERWLVSYADFITLLFAFFVVMYSVSSVNEDKYRVLSDSMTTAFHSPESSRESIQVDKQAPTSRPQDEPVRERVDELSAQDTILKEIDDSFSQQVLDEAEFEVDTIAVDVEGRLEESIEQGEITVKRNKFWLEIEIKSNLLFLSGSGELIPGSIPLLVELSKTLVTRPNRIHIEGFTDDKPITTNIFPSNWELSGARAAAVVRLFESNGIAPSRLAAIGYGEYQPVAGNQTEEGRAMNRRVVVVVMASLEGRQDERIYEFDLLQGK